MKLRDVLQTDEFQGKSIDEKQAWLSQNVKGFDVLPLAEKRKFFTAFGSRPESAMTKIQMADRSVSEKIPGFKFMQDMALQRTGDVAGAMAGTAAAPFVGPAAPVMPFVGARMGEGAGQALSDYLHGASGKESMKNLYRTPAMNAAFMGAFSGVGKAAKSVFPKYAKSVMKIDEPLTEEMIKSGGDLPKATQEESTKAYTKTLRKTTGSTMEPAEELNKLADQFESKVMGSGKIPEDVKTTVEQVKSLKKSLGSQYKTLFEDSADAARLRDLLRKRGLEIPAEDMLKKAQGAMEKSGKTAPTKIPIHPAGTTADQEMQIAYHLRRLMKQSAEVSSAPEPYRKGFTSELYRLRRWIDQIRNYGGEEIKDSKSLDKMFKNRMNEARARVQGMMKNVPEGEEIQKADSQLLKEKSGRAYNRLMPEGRGSMYHLGAAFSPFLLYHLGIPFLPATMLASVLSSPRAAKTAFKYGPKVAPDLARMGGLATKEVFSEENQ